jgi:hypothetical protein
MSHPEVSSRVAASPPHIAARVRAALAYANLRYEDVADKASPLLTAAKLRRIASARTPRGADLVELWAIADACDVPREWLERGTWDDTAGYSAVSPPRWGEGSLPDRVAVLERYVRALIELHEAQTGEYPLPPEAPSPRPLAR